MQHITPTRTSRAGDLAFVAVFILAVIGCIALAQADDERADAELERIALAERVRLAQAQRAADHQSRMAAYEAGLSDAMQSMRHTPQGVELVQACMALKQLDRSAP